MPEPSGTKPTDLGALCDVVAVRLSEPHTVTVFARSRSKRDAETIITMAVIRRGVENEFYTTAAPGKYKDGDIYAN